METTCPLCACPRAAADVRGLAWSSQHGPDGAVTWICPDCTRSRLMEIETQFPLTAVEASAPSSAA
jgi:hypothetical protein